MVLVMARIRRPAVARRLGMLSCFMSRTFVLFLFHFMQVLSCYYHVASRPKCRGEYIAPTPEKYVEHVIFGV